MSSPARSIILIGMMGAGKSSVGRCLQRKTGLQIFDIDEIVSGRARLSIPEIFAQHGEQYFRDAESEVLSGISSRDPAVIVTGGGIVLRDENVKRLKELGLVAWLAADESILFERAGRRGQRPLLQTNDPKATIAELSRKRTPLYAKAADFRVDTSQLTHDEVCDRILAEIEARARGEG